MKPSRLSFSFHPRAMWALPVVFIGVVFRELLFSGLGRGIPYLTFFPAVALASILGGLSGGIFATALSFILVRFWILHGIMSALDWAAMSMFIFSNLLVSFMAGSMHSNRQRLKESLSEVEGSQEELKETNAYLENLINYANAPIIVWDPEFQITRFNHAFESLTGRTESEVLGKSLKALFPSELIEDSMNLIRKTRTGERWETVEIKIQNLDGTVRTLLWNSATLFAPDGTTPVATIAQGQDITERKQAEEERTNLQLQLQLQQTQKLESLGLLVAGVAHNLNNVLAIVMGTASLREALVTEPLDRDAYQKIGMVCRRGRDVVKSLIHFSQPSLVTQTPIELNSLVQEVCDLLDSTSTNQVKIIQSLIDEALWIQGNAGDVNHILVNLCINSLHAMPNGGTLTLRTAILEGNRVEVSVEDSGTGMTPEVLVHVMEPFYTTKDASTGDGLGLSMTYGVIQAHGGTIEIASQPGQGTTVKLGFPRISAPVHMETAREPAQPLKLRKVLLVDDEEDVRFLMTRMLKKAGVGEVETAASGEEAMSRLLPGELPDALILDQNMPGMTGVQLMARVRARYPDLPILFSSGQPDIESWEILKQPAVRVISKPFTMEEIQAKLAEISLKP